MLAQPIWFSVWTIFCVFYFLCQFLNLKFYEGPAFRDGVSHVRKRRNGISSRIRTFGSLSLRKLHLRTIGNFPAPGTVTHGSGKQKNSRFEGRGESSGTFRLRKGRNEISRSVPCPDEKNRDLQIRRRWVFGNFPAPTRSFTAPEKQSSRSEGGGQSSGTFRHRERPVSGRNETESPDPAKASYLRVSGSGGVPSEASGKEGTESPGPESPGPESPGPESPGPEEFLGLLTCLMT